MIASAGVEASETLAALHARAFDKAWSAAEIAKLLDNPVAFALIASDDAPQGFLMAWVAAEDCEILTLAVAPEARRRGVAAKLVAAAMASALVRGATGMTLDVAEDNEAARGLYAQLGFTEEGRRPRYYARADGAVDALLLRRALARPPI
ncbi:MAG: GNAT family N-acetyltransferase [Terricaulis sp.]